jgi:hypothetical protein
MFLSRWGTHAMNVADITDRLAAPDHELGRLEALRALAQSNADTAEVARLGAEIDLVRRTRGAFGATD